MTSGRLASVAVPLNAKTAAIIGAIAVLVGVATVQSPALVVVALIASCGLLLLRALPRLFLGLLWTVILGYAFLGRSVAYLGAPPVFVGEILLGVGLVAALVSGALPGLVRSPVAWLIVCWAMCGVFGTLPYVGKYSTDALRDAVLWGYGAFAITVAACLMSTRALDTVIDKYRDWMTALAAWPVFSVLKDTLVGSGGPSMPGTGVAFFSAKPGDLGVHLAGVAIYALVLQRARRGPGFWVLWLISLAMVASVSRGGFLAVVLAFAVVSIVEPVHLAKRVALGAGVAVAVAVVVLVLSVALDTEPQVAMTTRERSLSPRQLVENVLSITGRQAAGDLTDTRDWRLDWWGQIVDYTVFGRYFWTGKGFGVNLADDDGFQVASDDEAPLRSPHNVFMTVLARMGVPGAALFVLLQLSFAASLVLGYWRARRAGAIEWGELNLWILAYWTAFLVNGAFDVALEGPQAGIPFWCLVGLGIAVSESQRRALAAAEFVRRAA